VQHIAKIPGGPAYKQMMRATEALDGRATAYHTWFGDILEVGTGAAQAFLGLRSLGDLLSLRSRDTHSQSLSRMLKALKTATESYLEASISAAEVVVPFPVSDAYLDILRSTCFSLSLQMPMSAQPPAGILAARAHGMVGKCNDPMQLILTVDYTQAALTALMVVEECGIFEYRRVLHDTRLGVDGLSGGSDTNRGDLVRALQSFTRLPLEDGNGVELERISNLVLLGESADDQRLHDVLKDVLGERFYRLATTLSGEHTKNIDPLYAASRGVAEDCLDRLNFQPIGDPVD
jgi:hypothetical protein